MEKISFRTDKKEGDEHIMLLGDINPNSLSFNYKTREFFISYELPKKKVAEKKQTKKSKAKK